VRVHIQHEPDALLVLRQELAPGIGLSFGAEPPDPADYAVLVAGRPSPPLLAASARLRALVIPFAGLPAATAEVMRASPQISVHNLHHNAAATAELAMALLLAASKTIVPIDGRLRRGDWSDRGRMEQAVQLEGRRALVLGHGAIGRRVARACLGLGMEVVAVARREQQGQYPVHGVERLPELLPGADAVLVCLPATPQTEGLLGPAQIALLTANCVLVNVARGPIIDESALYEALRQGRIFAAGLDVWWRYPAAGETASATFPSSLPFHELPNVVMSPHRGGHVQDTELLRMRALAELLNAAALGREIPNKVDLQNGY
jgi:phosphoglycerate dehydrogenase-like enzyme